MPAAFGRLCVETMVRVFDAGDANQPPSGGCVLKLLYFICFYPLILSSRLRAAVC